MIDRSLENEGGIAWVLCPLSYPLAGALIDPVIAGRQLARRAFCRVLDG